MRLPVAVTSFADLQENLQSAFPSETARLPRLLLALYLATLATLTSPVLREVFNGKRWINHAGA